MFAFCQHFFKCWKLKDRGPISNLQESKKYFGRKTEKKRIVEDYRNSLKRFFHLEHFGTLNRISIGSKRNFKIQQFHLVEIKQFVLREYIFIKVFRKFL